MKKSVLSLDPYSIRCSRHWDIHLFYISFFLIHHYLCIQVSVLCMKINACSSIETCIFHLARFHDLTMLSWVAWLNGNSQYYNDIAQLLPIIRCRFTLFFSIYNVFHTNIEAEMAKKLRTLLRTSQPQIFEKKFFDIKFLENFCNIEKI